MDDVLKRLALTVLATVGARDTYLRRHSDWSIVITPTQGEQPLAPTG